MNTKKYGLQTRIIIVKHPDNPEVILFEAVVQIRNINKTWIDKIEKVNIAYKLKEKN